MSCAQVRPDRRSDCVQELFSHFNALCRDNEQEHNLILVTLAPSPNTERVTDQSIKRWRLDDMIDLGTAKPDTRRVKCRITSAENLQAMRGRVVRGEIVLSPYIDVFLGLAGLGVQHAGEPVEVRVHVLSVLRVVAPEENGRTREWLETHKLAWFAGVADAPPLHRLYLLLGAGVRTRQHTRRSLWILREDVAVMPECPHLHLVRVHGARGIGRDPRGRDVRAARDRTQVDVGRRPPRREQRAVEELHLARQQRGARRRHHLQGREVEAPLQRPAARLLLQLQQVPRARAPVGRAVPLADGQRRAGVRVQRVTVEGDQARAHGHVAEHHVPQDP